MGKNKNKNKDQKAQTQQAQTQEEPKPYQQESGAPSMMVQSETQTQTAPTQTEEVETQPVVQEPVLTPEERADAYKQQNDEVYSKFINELHFDEDYLKKESDFSAKADDLVKFKVFELKKYEKTVKKEQNEIEDIYQSCRSEKQLQLFQERIQKTLQDVCRKAAKKQQQTQLPADISKKQIETIKVEISKLTKQKNFLSGFCQTLFDKNYKLYLKHERMLDEEKAKRNILAEQFQGRMSQITDSLNNQKETRGAQIEENMQIKTKINQEIETYKKKEANYKKEMDEYQAKMKLTETNFKKVIDTRINPVMEKLNVAKAKFEKSEKYCSELTTSIKAMSGKFDDIKNGMESMEKSKKEQEQQIETLSMQQTLLMTEIENFQLWERKRVELVKDNDAELKQLQKQAETLDKLAKALTVQLK